MKQTTATYGHPMTIGENKIPFLIPLPPVAIGKILNPKMLRKLIDPRIFAFEVLQWPRIALMTHLAATRIGDESGLKEKR